MIKVKKILDKIIDFIAKPIYLILFMLEILIVCIKSINIFSLMKNKKENK